MSQAEPGAAERAVQRRIERELEERAGINAIVEVRDGEISLSGLVDTEEARQAAADIVAERAPGLRLSNDLEVQTTLPTEVSDFYSGEAPGGEAPGGEAPGGEAPASLEEMAQREMEIDPDFTDQPLDTSGIDPDVTGTSVEENEGDEEGDVFFAPTDPVLTTDQRGEVQVLGGFSPTSDSDITVERSALDGTYGDEAIADAVRRELLEDAATTDLRVEVEVRNGVVRLRGTVQDAVDAENAEEVASRVPGVDEVVEELRVANA
jgi:osmotically-inducible protein OsmY